VHGLVVVQNFVYLDASSLEFLVAAILQVGLAKLPMLVVAIFGEDLPNVVPFYIFIAVSKGPWLRYILLSSESQLFWISKDMQPLPLNGTPPSLCLSASSLQSSASVFWCWRSMAS
jgi:hypothetical protein